MIEKSTLHLWGSPTRLAAEFPKRKWRIKDMKRKHNVVGALGKTAVALTLISTCLVGGTLAKYTSEVTGTGTSVTARWAFKAGSSEGATSLTTFTLGETVDGMVAKGKIAPGSTGTIPVYYDLTGTEVKTQLKVYVKIADVSKLPTNFKMTQGSVTKTKTDFTNDVFVEIYNTTLNVDNATHTLPAATAKGNANITWQWPFETGSDATSKKTGDSADTTDGAAANTVNFTVKVEATQLAS